MKFTDKAIAYLKTIYPENQILRVKVVGGGCSGLSYAMEFTSDSSPDDISFTQDDMDWVVDKKSSLFLKDVEIDHTSGLNGTGFVFKNPASKQSCGCGSSFSV